MMWTVEVGLVEAWRSGLDDDSYGQVVAAKGVFGRARAAAWPSLGGHCGPVETQEHEGIAARVQRPIGAAGVVCL